MKGESEILGMGAFNKEEALVVGTFSGQCKTSQAVGECQLWVYAVPATRSHETSSPRPRAAAACQTPGEIALLNCRQKCSKNLDIVFGNLIWKYCLRNFEGKNLKYLIQVYADSCTGFLCMHAFIEYEISQIQNMCLSNAAELTAQAVLTSVL